MDLDLIDRARAFATAAHAGQLRKFVGTPYVAHPIEIAAIVASVPGATPEMIQAALLHDVVEDTPVTLEEIRGEFGEDVARLVDEVTKVSKRGDGNRAVRKAMDCLHFAAASPEGQTNKLAGLRPQLLEH
jgi:(p)ppGpp synthase/HD superfamily hydrolase